jgi:hypothetical protein
MKLTSGILFAFAAAQGTIQDNLIAKKKEFLFKNTNN